MIANETTLPIDQWHTLITIGHRLMTINNEQNPKCMVSNKRPRNDNCETI